MRTRAVTDVPEWLVKPPAPPACVDMDTELFYASSERDGKRSEYQQIALAACARCAVREWCLERELTINPNYQQWGIVGGTLPSQRQAMLRKRKAERKANR